MSLGPAYGGTGGAGGGFILGPLDNFFGTTSGDYNNPVGVSPAANKSAAEALRNSYAGSNPAWLAEYDDNSDLTIWISYLDGGNSKLEAQGRVNGNWASKSSASGVRGPEGNKGSSGSSHVFKSLGVIGGEDTTLHGFYSAANNSQTLEIGEPALVNVDDVVTTFIWFGEVNNPDQYTEAEVLQWQVAPLGTSAGTVNMGGVAIKAASNAVQITTAANTLGLVPMSEVGSDKASSYFVPADSQSIALSTNGSDTLPKTISFDATSTIYSYTESFTVTPAEAGTLRLVSTSKEGKEIVDAYYDITLAEVGSPKVLSAKNEVIANPGDITTITFSDVALKGGLQPAGDPLGGQSAPLMSANIRISNKLNLLDERDLVSVDGVINPDIVTANGVKSDQIEGETVISLSGKIPVAEVDVSVSASLSVDRDSVGFLLSLIQTVTSQTQMTFTLVDHDQFQLGDTVRISAARGGDDEYLEEFFRVDYTRKNGSSRTEYAANNIILIRTKSGWDVGKDGTFTTNSIKPSSTARVYNPADSQNFGAAAFIWAEHPAVEIVYDLTTGKKAVSIDLNLINSPSLNTVDIVAWWSENEIILDSDINTALSQPQTLNVVSHTDDIKSSSLPVTVITAKREESSAKYMYFAYPAGFFTDSTGSSLEPSIVNTGSGNSPDWVIQNLNVSGVTWRVQRSPAPNFAIDMPNCKLIQEGYR